MGMDSSSPLSPPQNPTIEDLGMLMVAKQGPPGPMELIRHFLESKCSKSSRNASNKDTEAPSTAKEGAAASTVGKDLQVEATCQGLVANCCKERAKDAGRARQDLIGYREATEASVVLGDKKGSELCNDENGGSQLSDARKKSWRNRENAKGTGHPVRPDADDCLFYMKFGSCKFGISCKFNHPPGRHNQVLKERSKYKGDHSEKAGLAECKFYLTTGGCRNGQECKYSHGSDRSFARQILGFNLLGFPIRPGENECPYYMRTGSCKYGASCRFHHPEPAGILTDGSTTEFSNNEGPQTSYTFPYEGSETMYVSSTQTQILMNSISEWNSKKDAKSTYESGLPIPPAFSMDGAVSAGMYFPLQLWHNNLFEEYPERPGEQECSFFMKTGVCKYKSKCKFHHPKNRISRPRLMPNTSSVNEKGLPLRPDKPICKFYYRYGICKLGPACKYDHSSNMDDVAAGSWEAEVSGDA